MNNNKYIAIIGDLIGSRKLINRKEIQNYLWRGLQRINSVYKKKVFSEFVLIGDEFQGVVSLDFPFRKYLWYYDDAMVDIKTRFGLGVGALTTDINVIALEMDGPCLHSARKAIIQAKSQKERVVVDGYEEGDRQKFLNICLSLTNAIESTWTNRQRLLVKAVLGGKTQYELAAKLNVSRQAVQQQISLAAWKEFKEGWDVITNYMNPRKVYSLAKFMKSIDFLMRGLMKRWTKRQRKVFKLWESEDFNIEKVAKALKINYRTVSKILRAAHYRSYFSAKNFLKELDSYKSQ